MLQVFLRVSHALSSGLCTIVMPGLSGSSPKDHTALRSLSSLIASLPASEHLEFREEFDQVCTTMIHSAWAMIDNTSYPGIRGRTINSFPVFVDQDS